MGDRPEFFFLREKKDSNPMVFFFFRVRGDGDRFSDKWFTASREKFRCGRGGMSIPLGVARSERSSCYIRSASEIEKIRKDIPEDLHFDAYDRDASLHRCWLHRSTRTDCGFP